MALFTFKKLVSGSIFDNYFLAGLFLAVKNRFFVSVFNFLEISFSLRLIVSVCLLSIPFFVAVLVRNSNHCIVG